MPSPAIIESSRSVILEAVVETTSNVINMNGDIIVSSTTSPTSGTASAFTWVAWNRAHVVSNDDYLTTRFGSGTTSVTASTTIWTNWNSAYGTGGGSATPTTLLVGDPWVAWNIEHGRGVIQISGGAARPDVRISDEEYRAREARREAARVEHEEAKARAELLLREHLTDEQKAELADKRYFSLTKIDSKTGERRHYRIHHGRAGNVEQVDDNGRRLKRFCIHPTIACPDADTMLTQKLWLEAREDEFRRVANHS